MKKFIILFVLLVNLGVAMAQIPQSFNYQGVAKTANNQAIASKTIKVRFTIRNGSAAGTALYSETRSVLTNVNGLFNVSIGSAGALLVTGTFSGIDWTAGQRWLQTEIDPNNGTTFTSLGAIQMQSVPYALAAEKIKIPFAASTSFLGNALDITNLTGTAINAQTNATGAAAVSGIGMDQGVGVKAVTDNNFGVLATANNTGTAVYGQSYRGIGGRFVGPVGNTSAALEAEHKGNGTALKAYTTGGIAVSAIGSGQGVGVSAVTDNNFGVLSIANNTGIAVYGRSNKGVSAKFETPSTNTSPTLQALNAGSGIAVSATSVSGPAVYGYSNKSTGVKGETSNEIGVKGVATKGTGVVGTSGNGIGVAGITSYGTGGYFSAPIGSKALETNGSVKIAGGTMQPGLGKVLTSDENGFASWQGPVAFRGSGLKPNVTLPNGSEIQVFDILTNKTVEFKNEEYDYGSNYASSVFTAPFTGIYHFNAGVLFDEQSYNTPLEEGFIRIIRKKADGSKSTLATIVLTEFTEYHNGTIAVDALVLDGEKIYVEVYVSVVDVIINRRLLNKSGHVNNWFSGHLVSRVN